MSSESQNRTFPGIRKPSTEQVSLISRNVKTRILTVDSNTTLKGNLSVDSNTTLEGNLYVSGFSTLTSGLNVGTGGSDIYKIVSGTVSADPGNIDANTRGSVNVTVTGVNTSDRIFLNPPSGLNSGLLYCGCDVTASNTLTIYLYNTTGGAINDGAQTWKYTYLIFTD